MLDIPWRVKLLLPMLASLPLLIAYSGATAISLPKPLRVSGPAHRAALRPSTPCIRRLGINHKVSFVPGAEPDIQRAPSHDDC